GRRFRPVRGRAGRGARPVLGALRRARRRRRAQHRAPAGRTRRRARRSARGLVPLLHRAPAACARPGADRGRRPLARPDPARAARRRRLRLRPGVPGPGGRADGGGAAAGPQERGQPPRTGPGPAARAPARTGLTVLVPPPLSLYVHLPWCVRKCPYCDFNSHERRGALPFDDYVRALVADLDFDLPLAWGRTVHSVFFGGGTPSLFPAAAIDAFLQQASARLRFAPGCEITLETNPGTVEHDRFEGYRAAGVNRLSFGIQSFDDACLRRLGRIHDAAEARAAVRLARDAGFDNINLDLMYALPGQDLVGAVRDVEEAIALAPAHISHYQLTLEP